VEATPARGITGTDSVLEWDEDAQDELRQWVQQQPVLVQISAAKTLRDRAEQLVRDEQAQRVTAEMVRRALDSTNSSLQFGQPMSRQPAAASRAARVSQATGRKAAMEEHLDG